MREAARRFKGAKARLLDAAGRDTSSDKLRLIQRREVDSQWIREQMLATSPIASKSFPYILSHSVVEAAYRRANPKAQVTGRDPEFTLKDFNGANRHAGHSSAPAGMEGADCSPMNVCREQTATVRHQDTHRKPWNISHQSIGRGETVLWSHGSLATVGLMDTMDLRSVLLVCESKVASSKPETAEKQHPILYGRIH
jgi:hypothetical protein